MRIVAQRVSKASVTVGGIKISQIDKGIMALVGVFSGDTMEIAENMASKLAKLRVFSGPDENGEEGKRWEHSLMDCGGAVLCVSQFTLCASLKKGSKPDFHAAMPGDDSKQIFDYFVETLRKLLGGSPDRVQTGQFGSKMAVELINDGPVTIVFDSSAPQPEKERRGSKPNPANATKQRNSQMPSVSLADEASEKLKMEES